MSDENSPFSKIEKSFAATVIGILFLFSFAVIITLLAPRFIDSSWVDPSSDYQVQMYEVSDPHSYISNSATGAYELQYVQHVINGFTLFGYFESAKTRFVANDELMPYVTHFGDDLRKITSKLLLLREPINEAKDKAAALLKSLKKESLKEFTIYELYDPKTSDAFVYSNVEGALENWIDSNFVLVGEPKQPFHVAPGVIYVENPFEYRIREIHTPTGTGFTYDPKGMPIASLEVLKGKDLGFTSRKELIELGEKIYAIEGCWYCHTDQTRTLVQDLVANGWEDYPSPPSTANEYIYQQVSFPGTKRNGPDISRTGVKKPSRDWHRSHFWSPKTESPGSIMPSFHHFFDTDPSGTAKAGPGVPNKRFEAIYQYLMTKGTRITPPTQAWWLGKDPVQTKQIIEGLKK